MKEVLKEFCDIARRGAIMASIFLTLFFIGVYSASAEVIPSPSTLSIDLLDGQEYSTNISIFNNFSFAIYNVTFSGLPSGVTSDIITSIEPKETKNLRISAQSTTPTTSSSDAKIYFLIKVDREIEPKTYYINISDNGFSPRDMIIKQGDSIIWHNYDTITHSVTSDIFDNNLPAEGEYSYSFGNVGEYSYRDVYVLYRGNILVVNRSNQEYVYYSNYDINFPLALNVAMHQTDLVIDLAVNDTINCPLDKGCEIIVKISNNNDVSAKNVTIEGAMSNKNYFDIAASSFTYAVLSLQPQITKTEDTNKTMDISILFSGINFPSITKQIPVFVPFFDLSELNLSTENWWVQKLIFCREFPNSSLCMNDPIIEYRNVTIYRTPEIPVNYTADEVREYFQRVTAIDDKLERNIVQINEIKTTQNQITGNFISINDTLNALLQQDAERAKESESTRKTLIIFAISIFMIIATLIGVYFMNHPDKLHLHNTIMEAKK